MILLMGDSTSCFVCACMCACCTAWPSKNDLCLSLRPWHHQREHTSELGDTSEFSNLQAELSSPSLDPCSTGGSLIAWRTLFDQRIRFFFWPVWTKWQYEQNTPFEHWRRNQRMHGAQLPPACAMEPIDGMISSSSPDIFGLGSCPGTLGGKSEISDNTLVDSSESIDRSDPQGNAVDSEHDGDASPGMGGEASTIACACANMPSGRA